MGTNVHLQVSFGCDWNDDVAKLAARHLKLLDDAYSNRYARMFLADLSERSGYNAGPKGGLSLWGIIANGKDEPHYFVKILDPFWRELINGDVDGGPVDHSRVVVIYEVEQSEAAWAVDIGWENEWPEHWGEINPRTDKSLPDDRVLVVRNHGPLPFAWRQY